MEDKTKQESEFYDILNHDLRRTIIKLLYDRIELSYSDILKYLNIATGHLNFHLKKLNGLIKKTESGTYILTDRGKFAYMIISQIHETIASKTSVKIPSYSGTELNIVFRRITAFIIDLVTFFLVTGVLADPLFWGYLYEAISHLNAIILGHPWIFHPEHIPMLSNALLRLIGAYSHVFFAMFIFMTLLESYKGQTLGKFIMGIRVVKSNGRKLSLTESGIRNAGKIFMLPLDLLIGLIAYYRRGYLRFFDYYIDCTIEKIYRAK